VALSGDGMVSFDRIDRDDDLVAWCSGFKLMHPLSEASGIVLERLPMAATVAGAGSTGNTSLYSYPACLSE